MKAVPTSNTSVLLLLNLRKFKENHDLISMKQSESEVGQWEELGLEEMLSWMSSA